ncbi:MAG: hypothetical protein ACHQIO_09150 [Nevskiales bacterium]
MPKKILKTMTALAASLILFGCTSNGEDVAGGGGIIGGSSSGGPANDGTGPTNITQGGTPVTGNFICTQGAKAYGNVTTQVGSNGLVGGLLTTLLNLLGATTVTQLLNSVSNPDNVIDGNLDTYASVSLTLGLLGGLLDSVDESVVLPSGASVPAGKFAVYGLTFPKGTVSLSLLSQVKVATYLNNVAQESNTLDQNALALLGAIGGSTPPAVFVGVRTTKAYDRATISLTPGLLSVNVGDAMRIHELCTDGDLVTAP